MTTYREILASIVRTLRTVPGGDIDVQTQDVKEGFKRPSFFVGFEGIKQDNFMGTAKVRDITTKIVYFPTDKYKNQIEILEMMDKLEEVFIDDNRIEILEETEERDSVVIEIKNSDFTNTNDIIELLFDVTLDEKLILAEHEFNMEDLEMGDEEFQEE